ncbi:MAG TPA: hypothetical protein VKS79_00635, partial [Gemmataceae bacterium]|nr:hypothetical protein [Gemmataceae bacterium]
DWNFYGLVCTIDVQRHRKSNPQMPRWLVADYKEALQVLLGLALRDVRDCTEPATIQSILGAIALAKGSVAIGAFISNSDESENLEVLDEYESWSEAFSVHPL